MTEVEAGALFALGLAALAIGRRTRRQQIEGEPSDDPIRVESTVVPDNDGV